MAATTETAETQTAPRASEGDADQCVVMRGVGWKGYSALLRARGERARPLMVYLDGDVHLMSPAFAHESLKTRLGRFVMAVAEELDIACTPAGQTTFRRREKNGGVEGDESFYLANEPRIRGKKKLHLRTDPPPDLVVEAVNTHEADAAVEVWRRFGVPEVWVCDHHALRILVLQADGGYAEAPASRVFPFLTAAEVFEWVSRPVEGPETAWGKELRRWAAGPLRERVEGAEGRAKGGE